MLVRLVEHLNYHKIRCEIPPVGGTHQKSISFIDRNKLYYLLNLQVQISLNTRGCYRNNCYSLYWVSHLFKLGLLIEFFGVEFGGAAEIMSDEQGADFGAQVAFVNVLRLCGREIKGVLSHFKNAPDSLCIQSR